MNPQPDRAVAVLWEVGVTRHRSLAARCNCLSVERSSFHFACMEVCRRIASHTSVDWMLVKKIARYVCAVTFACNVEFGYQTRNSPMATSSFSVSIWCGFGRQNKRQSPSRANSAIVSACVLSLRGSGGTSLMRISTSSS